MVKNATLKIHNVVTSFVISSLLSFFYVTQPISFSKIFPKNEHFKITIYTSCIIGIWPFIFQENTRQRRLYNVYSNALFCCFIIYICSAIIQLFILISDDGSGVQQIVANLCITLLHIVTALRVSAIRTTSIKNLIKTILATEDVILKSDDEEVVKIYNFHVRQSQIVNLVFIANIMIETICYLVNYLCTEDIVHFNVATNETVVIKALPLSSWFPYDTQKHFAISLLLNMFDAILGAFYVMFTDAFFFGMIIFPLGQIRILIHVLSNFSEYVTKVKLQFQCSRDEASFLTLRNCILKHKDIIGYLKEYNDSMKNVMVLDFLQSSLQLASLAVQLFMIKPTIFNVIKFGQFIICMLMRLAIYYWYANEIKVESIRISSAIFECSWYNESKRVKQMILLVMIRSNRALALNIGPFATMTLNTLVAIIKTTYSYMMILYR